MHDIRLAVALIGFLSVAAFALVFRLLRSRSKHFLDFSAAIIVVLVIVYVCTVWGQLWIVNWIPLPSVIVLSNWFPILLSMLAAAVWLRLEPASIARRAPVMLALLIGSVYSVWFFIPSEPPVCENKWVVAERPFTVPVCLQTTKFTCSAAAAATILNALGMDATEQEMAKLCLTRSGTTWLGLYHGVSTKLLGTPFQVEFFEGDVAAIQSMAMVHPVLLCCQLDVETAEIVPDYVTDDGWIPGTAHSVVYFGSIGDAHVIGDPSIGYEVWSTRDINTLWTGTGLRIVERRPSSVVQRD